MRLSRLTVSRVRILRIPAREGNEMKKKIARLLRKWAGLLDPQGRPGRKRSKVKEFEPGTLLFRKDGDELVAAGIPAKTIGDL